MPDQPRRPRVAVVFGGRSVEHPVSCVSAGSVLTAIDRDRYDVVAVGVTREGRWVLAGEDAGSYQFDGDELPAVDPTGTPVALPADPTVHGLVALEAGAAPRPLGPLDVVFPLLHGPYGEDGTIQGLLEMAGVGYVGSGVLASAAAMDKEFMKLVLASHGLPGAPFTVITDRQWTTDRREALDRAAALGLPAFVKPARGGSSLGISRVTTADELPGAVEEARANDPKVVVEAAVAGREIECGVLEGRSGQPPEASLPAEIRVADDVAFYDFRAKYFDEAKTRFDVPADLPPELTEQVRRLAVRAFEVMGCQGLARVDFFLTPDGELVVNEVNTMPGFTPASMFPRMWQVTGLDYPALIDRLISAAADRPVGLR